MAAKKKAAKAGAAAIAVKNTPYVQRLVEDEELRENIAQAYDSARAPPPASERQVADEGHVRRQEAAEGSARRGRVVPRRDRRPARGPKQRKRPGFGKLLLLAVVGAGLALALSEGLRKKVLDTLFGAEEEFEYTSTTASPPVTPADAGRPRAPGARAPTNRQDRDVPDDRGGHERRHPELPSRRCRAPSAGATRRRRFALRGLGRSSTLSSRPRPTRTRARASPGRSG